MRTEHGVVVHLVDVVTGENQNIIRIPLLDEGDVLINGIGCALIPFTGFAGLVRRQNKDAAIREVQVPRRAGTNVRVQLQGTILCQHADDINAGIRAVGQREINNSELSAKRYCRLCNLFCQDAKTTSLAASEQHGDTFLFPHGNLTPLIRISNSRPLSEKLFSYESRTSLPI